MASIGKLVSVIAAVEGLDEGTVKLIARYAREAGYISQGTYGPGAARMTPRDAANLLIAVNASDLAKNAASVIETFRNLKGHDQSGASDEIDDADPFEVALRGNPDFGSALETIIAEFIPKPGEGHVSSSDLFISFERPTPAVIVDVGDYSDPDEPENYFYTVFGDREAASKRQGGPDRKDVTTIGSATLSAVGHVLAN